MKDHPNSPIEKYFWPISHEIYRARSHGHTVLIHCHMGMSRSVTALAAYYLLFGLPHIPNPSVHDVLSFLKERRPLIEPNEGFIVALRVWHQKIRDGKLNSLLGSLEKKERRKSL
jgi:protein-tyrosine phosphatase